jgi:hypothetical protein
MKSTSLLMAVLVAPATPAYAQSEGDSAAESPCIVSCVEVHQLCRAPCVPYDPDGELDYSTQKRSTLASTRATTRPWGAR